MKHLINQQLNLFIEIETFLTRQVANPKLHMLFAGAEGGGGGGGGLLSLKSITQFTTRVSNVGSV